MEKWNELCLPDIEDSHIKSILELQYANYQYVRWVENILKPFNISNEQFNVMKVLQAEFPNMMNLKEIQIRLPNQTKNTTRLVDKLKQKGFLSSEINPENKRQLQIVITAEGLRVLEGIQIPFSNFVGKLKNALTLEESKQLSLLLSKFYKLDD